MEPDPDILRRLDPALHAFGAARTDLSLHTLAAVRESLNARRAEAVGQIDTTGVDIIDTPVAGVPVRIYRGAPSPSPAVIYCHAGAFVLGNLDTDHRQCVELARRARCILVSVDYRLAPENPYPAGFDDVATVLQWAWTAADDLGIDRGRLALAGNSGGAALAAGLAQRSAAEEVPPIVGLLLHQPVLDDRPTASKAEFGSTPGFDGPATVAMWRHYLGASEPSAASVPARSHQMIGAASTFITCSELDPLRDEALDYARRLLCAGVRTDLHIFGGTCHGFDSLCPDWEVSNALLTMQAGALQRFFGPS
ncbi:alpha/beta hydrolase [Mycobacterium sp. EPa45]|uniref:alpha/beta hydrolase n=1 Tax=Mycobacterium sp. EPa45 TaxID=1545728 RepID=UPI000641F204|nr:alpha/beta hydrolase [Mycobacterium sp. EPa45]AKK29047.1 alpha/beta hydrolase [Mycobacterium sp. EPa45]